jgi:hypothetical protein
MRTEVTNRPQTIDTKNNKKNKQEIAAASYAQRPNVQQQIGSLPKGNR